MTTRNYAQHMGDPATNSISDSLCICFFVYQNLVYIASVYWY